VGRLRVTLSAIGAGACAAAVACSVLVPLDDKQCSSDADCRARGGAFANAVCSQSVCVAPAQAEGGVDAGADAAADASDASEAAVTSPWSCLASPPGPSDPTQQVDVQIITFDSFQPYTLGGAVDGGNDLQVIKGVPMTGVTVTACNALDPTCRTPVVPSVVTGDAGVAEMTLPGDFVGFFTVARSDVLPTNLYTGRLLAHEPKVTFPDGPLLKQNVQYLGQAIGIDVSLDPDGGLGHLFYTSFDCADRHVAGVSFALSSDAGGSSTFYLQNGLPNVHATVTDSSGSAGTVNVPVGNVQLTASFADGGSTIGTYNVFVQPATATIVWVRPRVR